jgi:phage terminase large subunit GpA-like protein
LLGKSKSSPKNGGTDEKIIWEQRLTIIAEFGAAEFTASRARDAGNTVLSKEFPAGFLIITGANSAVGRSMPARYLFLDEVALVINLKTKARGPRVSAS